MKRLLFFLVLSFSAFADGNLPTNDQGAPLNLDFEKGTLKDWTAEGTAFAGQPVKGDAVSRRRADMTSAHSGEFWIGSYEVGKDEPQGTLTSARFKVTQPFASFLIGGGNHAETRVELIRADSQNAFFKTTGNNDEKLRPVVVDLREHLGKEIYIRVIDRESGGWGHINFDDFKLYSTRPAPAEELKAIEPVEMPAVDAVKYAGLSPEDAAKFTTVPAGFKTTLVAGEPDVMQPIAFALDHRGRLWVAEAYTYPLRAPEGQGRDRILVLDDTDGDEKFDKRTVFIEGLNLVSGMEVGFGGVWVGAAPYLLFIPIQDGDAPKPAGKPQIVLDGWAYQDTHETLNTFVWGPDGWLYGCQGVFTHSNVGKPGSSDSERTRINAGVWRFHPTKRIFEVFAEGTSNPWGIDFDEHGQCFVEACVIPHLFHIIQGARYHRQAGQHFNPFIFDDIKTVADHVHYAGNKGPHAANSRSDSAGGGHAHAGLMIYQGDNWPLEYQNKIYIGNIHGQRINSDIPVRSGSGFVGKHGPDVINFNDKWSQVINFQSGPDGGVYFIDWYDKNQCHHNDANGHDRSNGRIFKITHGQAKVEPLNLEGKSSTELIELQFHPNDWYARHARRILQERSQTNRLDQKSLGVAINFLNPSGRKILSPLPQFGGRSAKREVGTLRVLWTLHACNALSEDLVLRLLKTGDEYVRAWSLQFLAEGKSVTTKTLKEFVRLAREDKSPVVRLYLASALQRIPARDRWDVVAALNGHLGDAQDHNLPLMMWYAAEPLAVENPSRAMALGVDSVFTNMLHFTTRRVAAVNTPGAYESIVQALVPIINRNSNQELAILEGLQSALKGQRSAPMPKNWNQVEAGYQNSKSPELRALSQSLSLTFGSSAALAELRKTAADSSAEISARRTAIDSLLAAKDANLAPLLQKLIQEPELAGPALRGLAAYEDAKTPPAILKSYASLSAANKRDALNTLVSRVSFAKPLLDEVEKGAIPVKDLTADIVRQLRSLKNPELEQQIAKVWGVSRDSDADKQKEIAEYKKMYRAGGSQPGDASRGRAIFNRVCQQCHTLFDVGGKIGPDLTGSNRADLDYILQNILDPNAVIPNDYRSSDLETTDERSITGIVTKQDDKSTTIVSANETLVIPRNEIKSLRQSNFSMMPEGLLQSLTEQEVRDLIYYLGRPGQVPLPKEGPVALFNGKDLTGWEGNSALWRVENGEIVGSTATGLKHNEFLKSEMVLENFRLVFKMKLTPNKENSGVQFRSEKFGEYEMKGCQADAGAGWWGKLYEENGRALLWNKPGEQNVNKGDWNTYEILAVDGKIRTAINGKLCVDLDDEKVSRRGITGLQMHSGGPLEVRFKDFQLEHNPKFELSTLKQP